MHESTANYSWRFSTSSTACGLRAHPYSYRDTKTSINANINAKINTKTNANIDINADANTNTNFNGNTYAYINSNTYAYVVCPPYWLEPGL